MVTPFDQITQWGVLAVGALAAIYGLLLTFCVSPSGNPPKKAKGYFTWPLILSAVITVLAVLVSALSGRVQPQIASSVLVSFAVGWALVGLLFILSRIASLKLAYEGGAPDQAEIGYKLLSSSGLLLCSAALIGMAPMLLTATIRQAVVEPFITLALGFWVATTFWSLPSVLYRWLLARENGSAGVRTAQLNVQFRSAPGETAFLAVSALAAAVSMAIFRFPEESICGRLYPLGAFACAVLFGVLVTPLLSLKSRVLRRLGMGIFFAGTGLATYFLAMRLLSDKNAFFCFGVGLATAMLLMLTSRYRPPFVRAGSPFGNELAIAQTLMLLASAILALRWMAGYGIALCAVGLFSSFAIVYAAGSAWAGRRAGEDSEVDLPFIAHAASRFVEVVIAGGAFFVAVALLIVFTERAGIRKAGVDITKPYPLIGLIIGASLPLLLKSISQSGGMGLKAGTYDQKALVKLGKWSALRTLGIWLSAGIIPMLVAFFWRLEAVGAFLVGLAAAELFLILTLWLAEARCTADECSRLATRSAHVLVVGSGLVTVLFAPPLIELTGTLTRAVKIKSLIAVFAVVFIWVFIVVWRKISAEKI